MEAMDDTPGMKESVTDAPPSKSSRVDLLPSLLGMTVLKLAFLFLDGPVDVLRAATVCHRWYTLATDDSVWVQKAKREGIVEKAGVFEVASCVGFASYAWLFVLQVSRGCTTRVPLRPSS